MLQFELIERNIDKMFFYSLRLFLELLFFAIGKLAQDAEPRIRMPYLSLGFEKLINLIGPLTFIHVIKV